MTGNRLLHVFARFSGTFRTKCEQGVTHMRSSRKLTPELWRQLVELVERGASVRRAMLSLGVSERTLRYWHRLAKEHPKSDFARLFADLERAESRYVARASEALQESLEERRDWRGWLAVLERKDPEGWGTKQSPSVIVNAGTREDSLAESRKRQEFLRQLSDEELNWLEVIAIKKEAWEEAEGDPEKYRERLEESEDLRRATESLQKYTRAQV
ncbi:protein of unknown function [Kyrpidia spormannii]|uniref:Uncharacterized protein n=1 Tax=Kyrpidia spormannii TaxID=2055160 RepID=A0ACA8Z864_9BACL|nr:protein of unknown function [Kyrpidia spormannii]